MIAANNSRVKIECYCYLDIKIDMYAWKQKFFVCDSLAWNIILGLPFIKQTKLILNLSKQEGYFEYNKDNVISLREIPMKLAYNNTKSEVKIGNDKYRSKIINLINENQDVFTENIGQALNYEVKLSVSDKEVVKIRPYALSPPDIKIMKSITDKWLEQGIIKPSMSPYTSPAFLVNKTEKPRLVVNYSKLNQKLDKMNYPIGDLHQCYHFLQNAKYFTVLDLSQSFLQIPLAKDSQYLTAFSTMYEQFEFTRIPYGLHCGSGLLSSYLNRVLSGIKFNWALNYIDDIILWSNTEEEHMSHIQEAVKRLKAHKLTVNPYKTKFFYNEVSFLGHIIKDNTISIDPDRTKAIRNCKPPKNLKQLASFLGMVNYFSKFIPNYASICKVLNDLRKKNVKFVWSNECQIAYEKLIESVTNPPVLHLANFDDKFILMTDSSEHSVAGCLMQEKNGNRVPIAYYSKKLTDTELKWSIYAKEAYAVVCCFSKFNQYLQLKPFLLITDNQALCWILSHKRKLGKLSRWVEQLMSLDFYTEHCRSKENPVSDYLSRQETIENPDSCVNKVERNVNIIGKSVNKCKNVNITKHVTKVKERGVDCSFETVEQSNVLLDVPLAFNSIQDHQKLDPEVGDLIKSVKNKTNKDNLYIHKDLLHYKKNDKSKGKIYIPESLFDMLFAYYHSSSYGCHMGYKKTVDKLCKYFYHPKLFQEVKLRLKKCELCKMAKPGRKYHGPLIATHAEEPMTRLYLDLIGPLTKSKKGNSYILIVVDDKSKFTWLFPLRDAKARSVINRLQDGIFALYSLCRSLVTDNAAIFRSTEFRNCMFKYGIEHRRLAPYRPSGNRSERYIQNVKNVLKTYYHDSQSSWDSDLSNIQLCLNTAISEVTGYSAFELLYTYSPNHGLSNLWKIKDIVDTTASKDEIKDRLQSALRNVKLSVQKNKKLAKYSDIKTKHPFKVGSLVTLRTHYLSNKLNRFTNRLALRFEGKYKIILWITPVTCVVQNVKKLEDVRKTHIGELKLL